MSNQRPQTIARVCTLQGEVYKPGRGGIENIRLLGSQDEGWAFHCRRPEVPAVGDRDSFQLTTIIPWHNVALYVIEERR